MNKTVAIVGSHPGTRSNAPFDDPNVDIWVFNEVAGKSAKQDDGEFRPWAWRVDAVFQMHLPIIYRSLHNRSDPRHWEWLQKEQKFPVYMLDVDPDVPSSVKYPLGEVFDSLLGKFWQGNKELKKCTRYSTSSIPYAIALAIYKGYPTIKIYGIEMSSNTEYIYQRDCVAFWDGYALGRGSRLEVHCSDDIFDRPLYGYNGIVDHRPEDFAERITKLEQTVDDLRKNKNKLDEKLHRNWNNGDLSDRISELAGANSDLGKAEGCLNQQMKYMHKIEEMYAEFGMGYIDRNEFEGSAAGIKKQILETGSLVHRTAGHVDIIMNSWNHTQNPTSLVQLKAIVDKHITACHQSGLAEGVYEENSKLAHEMDLQIRATGGRKAVEMVAEEMGYEIPQLDGEPLRETEAETPVSMEE